MTDPGSASYEEWARFGFTADRRSEPMSKRSMPAGAVSSQDLTGLVQSMTTGSTTNMGPNVPILPSNPPEGAPRQWDYPIGYNVQQRPRAYESVTFDMLRTLSENYDVARIAIETRIAEMRALDWAIIPRTVPGMSKKDSRERMFRLQDTIDAATNFWMSPDRVLDFGTWVGSLLDDLLSIDAPVLFNQRTYGGGLHALEIVDGATIRPIINLYGRRPEPPEPAYGQVIKGMTWGLYTSDEIMYIPYRTRPKSPYGYPPLEWVMLTVNRALRRQTLDLSMYTEGTLPAAFYKMPEDWTGTQLKELQQILDEIMSGNDSMRSRVRLMPGGAGSGLERIHPEPKSDVEEWLMTVTAAAFGTTPTELGFQPRGIGLGGKGFQEAQEAINYRKSLRPLGRHLKYYFDKVTSSAFSQEVEFQWTGLIEEADQLKQAQTDEIYWRIGVYSSDFIASKQDVESPGLGHIIAYNGNVIPVQAIINQYGEYQDDATFDSGDIDTSGTGGIQVPEPPVPNQPVYGVPDPPKGLGSPNGPSKSDGPAKPSSATAEGEQSAKSSAPGDLARWRRKALKSIRTGHGAAVRFESNLIPASVRADVGGALAKASSVDEVNAAFAPHMEGGTGTTPPFDLSAARTALTRSAGSSQGSLSDRASAWYRRWGFLGSNE